VHAFRHTQVKNAYSHHTRVATSNAWRELSAYDLNTSIFLVVACTVLCRDIRQMEACNIDQVKREYSVCTSHQRGHVTTGVGKMSLSADQGNPNLAVCNSYRTQTTTGNALSCTVHFLRELMGNPACPKLLFSSFHHCCVPYVGSRSPATPIMLDLKDPLSHHRPVSQMHKRLLIHPVNHEPSSD
jgi:hypothetical protein